MQVASSSSSSPSSSSGDSDSDHSGPHLRGDNKIVRGSTSSAPPHSRRQAAPAEEEEEDESSDYDSLINDDDDDKDEDDDESESSEHRRRDFDGKVTSSSTSSNGNHTTLSLTLAERLLRQEQEEERGGMMRQRRKQRKPDTTTTTTTARTKTITTSDKVESSSTTTTTKDKNATTTKKKSKSKHAPTEVSSRRRAYFDLNANGLALASLATYKPRDPRHSSLHGHLTEDKFVEDYQFVDELRQNEIKMLQQRIKASTTSGRKGREMRKKLGLDASLYDVRADTEDLRRLQDESRALERRQIERAAQKAVKEKFASGNKNGNYKPKRRVVKESLRAARLEEVRKRQGDGAVQKSLEKRRKREKSKDAHSMKI